MQGVVKSYDPVTRQGVILRDNPERTEYDLTDNALEGSIFRMLRQGQRVVFEATAEGLATRIRIGAEIDMGTPGFAQASDHSTESSEDLRR
jgi:cold shock CspA family protein